MGPAQFLQKQYGWKAWEMEKTMVWFVLQFGLSFIGMQEEREDKQRWGTLLVQFAGNEMKSGEEEYQCELYKWVD